MLQYDGTNAEEIRYFTRVYDVEVFSHFLLLVINKSYKVKMYITDYAVKTEFGFQIKSEERVKKERSLYQC